MHKTTNLWKFELDWSSELQDERKNTLVTQSCVTSFLENYVTSEGAVSHNVLYYQQLSIACNQVRFYAKNYFE